MNDKPVDLGGPSFAQGSSPWRQRHDACSGRDGSRRRLDSGKGILCTLPNPIS